MRGRGQACLPPLNMAYAPISNYRLAHFGRSIVVLDITNDCFFLIDPVDAEDLQTLFEESQEGKVNILQEAMIEAGLLRKSDVSAVPIKEFQPNVFFESRVVNRSYGSKLKISGLVGAMLVIIFSWLLIRICGFRFLSKLKKSKKSRSVRPQDHSRATLVADHVGYAFGILGAPGKCLGHSVSLWFALKAQGIGSTLCIGVRARPLLSHAWVELEDKVLNDDQDLRRQLSAIWEVQ